ncbi:MAG: fumarylacetoacetate hydrolase family protein [Gemmatimonadetes bacterium]|nr:fumarylacetoacetate hydrolase family protein [Gemmatimonadota bacterium]
MKIVRFEAGGKVGYGVVEGDAVGMISGSPFGRLRRTGESHALSSVRLLAPVPRPGKILALAENYRSHLGDRPQPSRPEPFFKTATSVIGPGDAIVIPPGAQQVHEEGELVAVIGRRARNVSESEALDCVLGYTCGNDVSARDWQRADRQWWRAKSADTFSPLGPWIVTPLDPTALTISVRLNGREVQRCRTNEMIYGVAYTIADLSKYVTLEPGDLLFTGTSGTTSQIRGGDVVEVEIEGIGTLRNPVTAAVS